jgi:hypothetical protein
MSNICRDCLIAVPAGEAVIRTISFRPVAYCRPCWDELHSDRPIIVPMPRESSENAPRRWSLFRGRSSA